MGFAYFITMAWGNWSVPLAAAITGTSFTARLTYALNKLTAAQMYGSKND